VTTPVQTTASWPDVDGRGNVVVPDTGARPMSLDCVGMERSVVRSQSHPPEWNSGSTVKGLRRALGASGNSYPPFRLPQHNGRSTGGQFGCGREVGGEDLAVDRRPVHRADLGEQGGRRPPFAVRSRSSAR
jgi:hypothetical protein